MPTPSTANLPRPKSADEFEDICADLLRRRWNDPNAIRNGRNGQAQHGVDIYSRTYALGAQCKNTHTIGHREISAEVQAAKAFRIPLKALTLMLSCSRDTSIQTVVDAIAQQQLQAGSFSVAVLFWEDIAGEIAGHPDLVNKYWQGFPRSGSVAVRQPETPEEFRKRQFGRLDEFGEYYEPDWYVLRKENGDEPLRPHDWLRIRVYSALLARGPFEPEDENDFASMVQEATESSRPSIVNSNGDEAIVELGGADMRFHRRWAWARRGCLGFTTTLRSLREPDKFSVPDLTGDVRQFLSLCSMVAPGAGVAVFELHSGGLSPSWLSADQRVHASIQGVVGEVTLPNEYNNSVLFAGPVHTDLGVDRLVHTSVETMVTALRRVFKVRISTKAFAESVAAIWQTVKREQAR